MLGRRKRAIARAAPAPTKNKPEPMKWVTECMVSMCCDALCHPLSRAPIIFYQYRGLRSLARAYPRLSSFAPERGYEFRSPAARQIPICRVMQTFNQKNPPAENRGIFFVIRPRIQPSYCWFPRRAHAPTAHNPAPGRCSCPPGLVSVQQRRARTPRGPWPRWWGRAAQRG